MPELGYRAAVRQSDRFSPYSVLLYRYTKGLVFICITKTPTAEITTMTISKNAFLSNMFQVFPASNEIRKRSLSEWDERKLANAKQQQLQPYNKFDHRRPPVSSSSSNRLLGIGRESTVYHFTLYQDLTTNWRRKTNCGYNKGFLIVTWCKAACWCDEVYLYWEHFPFNR
jgi:hypothetical protein